MPVAYVQAQLACQIEWLGQLILRAILLSSTPGFPGAQTQGHSLRTWARQGVTTGRAPGKGEPESGQWVSLVTRQRASRGTDWLSIGRGTSKLNTPGERRWGEGPGGGSVRERPVPKPGL